MAPRALFSDGMRYGSVMVGRANLEYLFQLKRSDDRAGLRFTAEPQGCSFGHSSSWWGTALLALPVSFKGRHTLGC